MIAKAQSAVEIVHTSWGSNPPEWVRRLAVACDSEGRTKVGGKIKRSSSLICMVLKNKYTGNLTAVKNRVEAALADKVDCPVLGEISGRDCMSHQQAPYNPINHQAVALFLACRKCPRNVVCQEKKS